MTNFKLPIETNLYRGWSKIGTKDTLRAPFDSFTMSFMLAVSQNHIYGVMGNESTNNADVFVYFLSRVNSVVMNLSEKENFRCCYLMDNVSIHKTKGVQSFAEANKINIITISPYSPSLNDAETVIQLIKAKVR